MTNLFEIQRTNGTDGNLQLGIGGAYFLTKSVAVEGILNYNSYKRINETLPIGQVQFKDPRHYSLSFNLGMQFYFIKPQTKSSKDGE